MKMYSYSKIKKGFREIEQNCYIQILNQLFRLIFIFHKNAFIAFKIYTRKKFQNLSTKYISRDTLATPFIPYAVLRT